MSSTVTSTDKPFSRDDTRFIGHPLGLAWLSACELWERFSYYGMQILLALYLTKYLFQPEHIGNVMGIGAIRAGIEHFLGPRTPLQLGLFIAGQYSGLVYLTPILGGLVADRLLGRTRTVVLGASLMAIGHFMMAFEASFFIAIACLLVGVGCFKGNIAAQVGALYAPGDKRNATAFQIFIMAVQIAVIAAPIVCGTLGEKVGFHWGFGAAGIGMLIGLATYLAGRGWLPPEPARKGGADVVEQPPLTRAEIRRVGVLILLLPVLLVAVIGNTQLNLGFTVWSDKHMDLMMFGWQVPVTWLSMVDAVVSTITGLASIAFWLWWSKRRTEPDELTKMALGSVVAAAGPAAMAVAGAIVDTTHGRVGPVWTLAFTLLNDIGFSNVYAISLALYSRVAPRQITGLVVGIYFLHLWGAFSVAGWLAGFMDAWSNRDFWALHALLVLVGAVLLFVARMAFGRLLSTETLAAERAAADAAGARADEPALVPAH
ncbi:MAG: peptide MFS transporter [Vitreoscilla sp.]